MEKAKVRKRLQLLVCIGIGACATVPGDPNASEQRFLLGADYYGKGMINQSLAELLHAIELNPNNYEAQNLLGLIFLRKGAEAEELTSRAQCLRGEVLALEKAAMEESFQKADKYFREALREKPDYSEASNNLAVVALHYGRYDEAISLEEKALSNIIYREPHTAQGNLGWAYLKKNDLVRAERALRQALFEQPKFCVGHFRLARVYYEEKELTRAEEELKQVIHEPTCPIQEAFYLAGLIALKKQERAGAKEYFDRCVALAPKSCLAKECEIAR
jgi:Tfp pilus assembly protein PilF